jgi:hypothetical protein
MNRRWRTGVGHTRRRARADPVWLEPPSAAGAFHYSESFKKFPKVSAQASETFRKPSISFRFQPKIPGEKLGLSETYA